MKILLLTAIFFLSLLSGGPEKCANLEMTLSTGAAPPGGSLAVFNKVTNCGTKSASFALDTDVTACGVTTNILSSDPADGKLNPNYAFVQAASYQVPNNGCTGTYTVTTRVRSGQQLLTTGSLTFEVQP